MATRERNERKFPFWEELSNGGRRYWKERPGVVFGAQRIVKFADASEVTLRIVQEVYDGAGNLIESHQKYPVDSGHLYHETE